VDDQRHDPIERTRCRNRHCPKSQGAQAREWLAAHEANLLSVGYFHIVFTVPADPMGIALVH
jgi:hypothetical protein